MTQTTEMIDPVTGEIIDQQQLAEQLLAQGKEQGMSLVGPGGQLGTLTKTVLETSLEAEMTEQLGYEKHSTPPGEVRGDVSFTEMGFDSLMGLELVKRIERRVGATRTSTRWPRVCSASSIPRATQRGPNPPGPRTLLPRSAPRPPSRSRSAQRAMTWGSLPGSSSAGPPRPFDPDSRVPIQ